MSRRRATITPRCRAATFRYPEVYAHLFGEPLLLLQRRRADLADQIDDCVLIVLKDGSKVTIPPGYAHILINPSERPALVVGLYSQSFSPVYEPIVQMGGACPLSDR